MRMSKYETNPNGAKSEIRGAARGGWLVAVAAACVVACGCESRDAGEGLRVFAGIPPVAYLVERVVGADGKVDVLIGPGDDPHTFEPTPRRVAALARATLYFRIGLPFEEEVLGRIRDSAKGLRVVDAAKGITRRRMAGDHGHEGHDHDAGGTDPHIWLNPLLAKVIASNICEALCAADGERSDAYKKNLGALHADLDRLHEEIGRALGPLKGKQFFVYHPAFGYFADAYGLEQAAVEVGGKSPSARQLTALIEKARAAGVRVIFVSPEFSRRSARAVAEAIGGAVVEVNPLEGNYIETMADIARKVERAISTDRHQGSSP